jgi:hypothetical protein
MVNVIPREWCCIGRDYETEPALRLNYFPSLLGRTNFAGDVDGPSTFRESSFAQVAEILLGVLGRAEAPEGPLGSINGIRGLDSQDLRCLGTRFFQLPQSHIGGSQGSTAESRIGRPQDTATKQSQRIPILIQHVACKTGYECCEWRIERINSHMRLGDFNRPHELAREHKRNSKPPVGKIGVQRDGPFECRDRFLRARPQRQRNSAARRLWQDSRALFEWSLCPNLMTKKLPHAFASLTKRWAEQEVARPRARYVPDPGALACLACLLLRARIGELRRRDPAHQPVRRVIRAPVHELIRCPELRRRVDGSPAFNCS